MDLLLVNNNIFELNNDDDYDDMEFVERRPYTMRKKPDNFQKWDDIKFFERFCLKKNTVLELLCTIKNRLLVLWNK